MILDALVQFLFSLLLLGLSLVLMRLYLRRCLLLVKFSLVLKVTITIIEYIFCTIIVRTIFLRLEATPLLVDLVSILIFELLDIISGDRAVTIFEELWSMKVLLHVWLIDLPYMLRRLIGKLKLKVFDLLIQILLSLFQTLNIGLLLFVRIK